jgi:UPF0716 protein FxsA
MGKKSGSGLVGVTVLLLPVLELVALIVVGGFLGAFRTVALFILLSIAGLYVFRARLAGLAAQSVGQAANLQKTPRTLGSAVLAVLGGALMILPGFVTAVVGIALQFSPLRAILAHRVTSKFTTTVGTVGTRFGMQDPFVSFGSEGFGPRFSDVIDTDVVPGPNDSTDRPSSPSSPELN